MLERPESAHLDQAGGLGGVGGGEFSPEVFSLTSSGTVEVPTAHAGRESHLLQLGTPSWV